jgi:hypothetical protein
MTEKLKPCGFICIHRSVVVNISAVEEIQPLPTGEYRLREILPLLVALEKSPDMQFTHLNAIMVLGSRKSGWAKTWRVPSSRIKAGSQVKS